LRWRCLLLWWLLLLLLIPSLLLLLLVMLSCHFFPLLLCPQELAVVDEAVGVEVVFFENGVNHLLQLDFTRQRRWRTVGALVLGAGVFLMKMGDRLDQLDAIQSPIPVQIVHIKVVELQKRIEWKTFQGSEQPNGREGGKCRRVYSFESMSAQHSQCILMLRWRCLLLWWLLLLLLIPSLLLLLLVMLSCHFLPLLLRPQEFTVVDEAVGVEIVFFEDGVNHLLQLDFTR
jgi:hypothetical protein